MASATIETLCCISSNTTPGVLQKVQLDVVPYNVICIISSLFGILGACYQLLPVSTASQISQTSGCRQKKIINWLAAADLFASTGILFRSVFWLLDGSSLHIPSYVGKSLIACASFSVWIRFFYTATYLWTLCYAVDVYLVSRQKIGKMTVYHVFVWSITLILSFTGLLTLYCPSFQCHSGPWRVLINYLLSYVPIICVMTFNPILYFFASKHLRILLSGCMGQLTCLEHSILANLKEKFFSIVLVFYVCWFPNILNGIILWGFWPDIPHSFMIGLWYVMACVNPLQAVLNSLVYKDWVSWNLFCPSKCCGRRRRTKEGALLDESVEYYITSADDHCNYSTNREYY